MEAEADLGKAYIPAILAFKSTDWQVGNGKQMGWEQGMQRLFPTWFPTPVPSSFPLLPMLPKLPRAVWGKLGFWEPYHCCKMPLPCYEVE